MKAKFADMVNIIPARHRMLALSLSPLFVVFIEACMRLY